MYDCPVEPGFYFLLSYFVSKQLKTDGRRRTAIPINWDCPVVTHGIFLGKISMVMEKARLRTAFLWAAIMAGFAIHCIADLMPLFWNADIAISDTGNTPAGMLIFMMTLSYLLPVAGLLCALYAKGRAGLIAGFILSCIIGLFCLLHLAELFTSFNPVQTVILPVMAVVGILLAADSYKALKNIGKE